MKLHKTIYFVFVLLTLASCSSEEIPFSEVDFRNSEFVYEISVEGFISNEYERCRVVLSKPLSINNKIIRTPIENAKVVLKHKNNVFMFEHKEEGEYFTIDSIAGVAGDRFFLEINYDGKKYFAETIMPNEPNDEFYPPFIYESDDDEDIELDDNQSSVNLKIYKHNFGYKKTNIWGFEKVNPDDITSMETYFYMKEPVYTHKGSVPQGVFPSGYNATDLYGTTSDSIEILKVEINKGYEKYLLDKFNETDWQGGMFSTIPGNVSTNLSKGATGYFYAINVKRKRFTIGYFNGDN